MTQQHTASGQTRTVDTVGKNSGGYIATCPYCRAILWIDGNDLGEVRDSHHQHEACGGSLHISPDARFIRNLP